jgi:hypothetical protein
MRPISSNRAISLRIVADETPNMLAKRIEPTGAATSAYCSTMAFKILICRGEICIVFPSTFTSLEN